PVPGRPAGPAGTVAGAVSRGRHGVDAAARRAPVRGRLGPPRPGPAVAAAPDLRTPAGGRPRRGPAPHRTVKGNPMTTRLYDLFRASVDRCGPATAIEIAGQALTY